MKQTRQFIQRTLLAKEVSDTRNDIPQFLEACTTICHEQIWGNLSCTLVVDDKTAAGNQETLGKALHELEYGAIGVNIWISQVYALMRCSWGGHPGNSLSKVSSGIGVVNNTYGVPNAEKIGLVLTF